MEEKHEASNRTAMRVKLGTQIPHEAHEKLIDINQMHDTES